MPAVEKPGPGPDQLRIVYLEQAAVGQPSVRERFQETVPLLQYFVVFDEILQVFGIQLGKEGVEEPPPFFAAAGDDLNIVRGDDHAG